MTMAQAKRWTWPGNDAVLQCKGQADVATQPPPPPSPAVCAAKLSCQDCFLSGCAWCIAARRRAARPPHPCDPPPLAPSGAAETEKSGCKARAR